MKTTEQRKPPPFATFASEVASAHPGIAFTNTLLRAVYRLANERLKYEREWPEEIERSAELRKIVSRLSRALKDVKKTEKEFISLRKRLLAGGFNPSTVHNALEPVATGFQSLIHLLESGRQDVIDPIFPTRAHGLEQKWEPGRVYDLPRLGNGAAYSWFIVSADDLLTRSCGKKRKPLPRNQEWAVLQTFVHMLFKGEGIATVEAIERLVRAARKERSRQVDEGTPTKANF